MSIAAQAQVSKIIVGKKVALESTGKTITKISMMGQEMEMPLSMTMLIDLNAKAIEANSLKAGVTLKKVSGTLSMMGQENSFSSDDKNISSNPQAAEMMKTLNKEEEVTLEDGKVKGKLDIGTTGVPTSTEWARMVFLTLKAENIKEGYKWTETSDTDGTKNNTIYAVTKVTATDIEVTATSSMKIEKTIQQMGMDMKQNLTGTSSSVRVYDALTAILKADATKIEMTGTMLVMGNEAPISISTISTTTVK
jgi:hypothetical protein